MVNRSTGVSPFGQVYTKVPNFTSNLATVTFFKSKLAAKTTEDIQAMMELAQEHLEIANKLYKQRGVIRRRVKKFHVGDMVIAHLSKGRTPSGTNSKFSRQEDWSI